MRSAKTNHTSGRPLTENEYRYINRYREKALVFYRIVVFFVWLLVLVAVPGLLYIIFYVPGGTTTARVVLGTCAIAFCIIAIISTKLLPKHPLTITDAIALPIHGVYQYSITRSGRHDYINGEPVRIMNYWPYERLKGSTVTAEICPVPILTFQTARGQNNPSIKYFALSLNEHSIDKDIKNGLLTVKPVFWLSIAGLILTAFSSTPHLAMYDDYGLTLFTLISEPNSGFDRRFLTLIGSTVVLAIGIVMLIWSLVRCLRNKKIIKKILYRPPSG